MCVCMYVYTFRPNGKSYRAEIWHTNSSIEGKDYRPKKFKRIKKQRNNKN